MFKAKDIVSKVNSNLESSIRYNADAGKNKRTTGNIVQWMRHKILAQFAKFFIT